MSDENKAYKSGFDQQTAKGEFESDNAGCLIAAAGFGPSLNPPSDPDLQDAFWKGVADAKK